MIRRGLLILAVLVIIAAIPGFSESIPTPEQIPIQPLFMSNPYPEDMDAVSASSAMVFLEVHSGFCCQLLTDRIRVTISACTAPRGTGFKEGDTGVDYDADFSIGGTDYLPGIKVDISDTGCNLPINGTPIEVTVLAEARTPLGGISVATFNWTFFATGSSSSSPPPAANQPPPFEIQSVSPRPLIPGQPRLINGRGFTSSTEVLFNTEIVSSTFNSLPKTISFRVPEELQCGDHSVQLRNPNATREFSNIMTFNISSNCDTGTRTIIVPPPILNLLRIESLFQPSGGPGDSVIVNGIGFIDGSLVFFNREGMSTTYIGPDSLRFTVEQGTPCGDYDVYVRNKKLSGDETSNTVTYSVITGCQQQGANDPPQPPNEDPPPNDPPPNDPPPNNNPPPPPANADEVEEFDTDNDCEISNSEFFAAVDSWLAGTLDNGLFFAILDAWISQSNVCSAAAVSSSDLIALSIKSARGIVFTTENQDVSVLAVGVYDLDGTLIFQSRSTGTKLSWNLRNSEGERVANGTYLYRSIVRNADGTLISTGIRKFIVQK
jgi:hypothetical protein